MARSPATITTAFFVGLTASIREEGPDDLLARNHAPLDELGDADRVLATRSLPQTAVQKSSRRVWSDVFYVLAQEGMVWLETASTFLSGPFVASAPSQRLHVPGTTSWRYVGLSQTSCERWNSPSGHSPLAYRAELAYVTLEAEGCFCTRV